MRKPKRSPTAIACSPEIRGSLGIGGNLESRHQWMLRLLQGKLFQVKFRSLFEVSNRLINGGTWLTVPTSGQSATKRPFSLWITAVSVRNHETNTYVRAHKAVRSVGNGS